MRRILDLLAKPPCSGLPTDQGLQLWGRMPVSDSVFVWDGDRKAGQRILAGPLTA